MSDTKVTQPFKKPRGDYYNLDLVVRDTAMGSKGHPILTDKILKDYKRYLRIMASTEGISITKYIHKLIDKDMEQNQTKYKAITRATSK